MEKETRILIIGSNACSEALAKKLAQQNNCKIYIAPGNRVKTEQYENIDIRPDDLTGLLKFSLEKKIDLTIPLSETALKNDIVSFFQINGENIFGPLQQACYPFLNKITGKKFIYKIHAQTSKFGIFDKLATAQTYLDTANYPVIIRAQENGLENDRIICPSISLAKKFLSDILGYRQESDILIEEFSYGENFTVYFITDGYSAIPITTVSNYKFTNGDKSGLYTDGIGCFCPNYKINNNTIYQIQKLILNVLKNCESKDSPYIGIIGADCTITGENKFVINEFLPFFRDFDAPAVINSIEDNLYDIFMSCINGSFSDEYEEIKTNDKYYASVVISAKQENQTITIPKDINVCFSNIKEQDGKILTKKGKLATITQNATTLKKAKAKLLDSIEDIAFDGMVYPKYILKSQEY